MREDSILIKIFLVKDSVMVTDSNSVKLHNSSPGFLWLVTVPIYESGLTALPMLRQCLDRL